MPWAGHGPVAVKRPVLKIRGHGRLDGKNRGDNDHLELLWCVDQLGLNNETRRFAKLKTHPYSKAVLACGQKRRCSVIVCWTCFGNRVLAESVRICLPHG